MIRLVNSCMYLFVENTQMVKFIISTKMFRDITTAMNITSVKGKYLWFYIPHFHTEPTYPIIHIIDTPC